MRVQAAARRFQQTLPTVDQDEEILRNLMEHWNEDSDVGIMEAILTYVANIMHSQALEEALNEFRESRLAARSKKAAQRHADTAQLTLHQAWAMGNIDTDAVMASDPASADLADTMQAQLQLLRLGNQWARLSQLQRKNIVAAVMQDLPDYYITKLADQIAQLYNGAGEPQPPTALLALRIKLREQPQVAALGQGEQVQSVSFSASDEEPKSKEKPTKVARTDGAGATKTRKQRRKAPKLTQRSQRELRTIPSQKKLQKQKGTSKEMGVQTQGRRRCVALTETKPKTEQQLHAWAEDTDEATA